MSGTTRKYDVFFSYNWRDSAAVEAIASTLQERGQTVFLDRWYLVPGRPWPQALEEALGNCQAVSVFLGPHGMGRWQQRETGLALTRQADDPAFPVIPVLLPAADPALGFLSLNTWVDMRGGIDDPLALSVLAEAVRGQALGPELKAQMEATQAAICPYRGLRAFREEDAPLFFGREAFTQRLVAEVSRHPMVAVVGASGCGKSSVVRAGLVPHLRQESAEQVWDVATLVPGDRPLHALAAALVPILEPEITEIDRLAEIEKLAKHFAEKEVPLRGVVDRVLEKQPGTDRLLLVVDQWEELYTLVHDEQMRQRFLDELLEAAAGRTLAVVITLRGDFFGRVLSHRALADRLQNAVVNLGPMTRRELSRAIESPAKKASLTFESGLVSRILDDVEAEPGNLPLLEFVLHELWEKRRAGTMHHESYQEMGAVKGAMARRADRWFERLSPSEQKLAQWIFIQLVQPGQDTADTRRRVTFAEVGEAATPIVQQLADARLTVTGRDDVTGKQTVEVAHEALIQKWGRLRGWIDTDREFLLWRKRLRARQDEWEQAGHEKELLLHGALLTEAERWLEDRADDIGLSELDFIQQSLARRAEERAARAAAEREREAFRQRELADAKALAEEQALRARTAEALAEEEEQRARTAQALLEEREKSHRFQRRVAVGVVLVFLVLAGAGGVIVIQHRISLGRKARQLASEARWMTDYDATLQQRSVLLALESMRLRSSWEADQALRHALALLAHPVADMAHGSAVYSAAFSPNGKYVATGSVDNTASVWDARTGDKVFGKKHKGAVNPVVFSPPNGTCLATASGDGVVRVWDVPSGEPVSQMEHAAAVHAIALSPNGKRMATWSEDGTVYLWDALTGEEVIHLKHEASVSRMVFSQQGRSLATAGADGLARVWDANSGKEVASLSHSGVVSEVVFSPDGKHLATTSEDGAAYLWDPTSGQQVSSMEHGGAVDFIVFSPTGNLLATASDPGVVKVWAWNAAGSGKIEMTRMKHEGTVLSVVFSPDERYLATGSECNIAQVWDVTVGKEMARMDHEASVLSVAFSPDGTFVATAGEDNMARVWRACAGDEVVRLDHDDSVRSAAFSPDGTCVATASDDNTVRQWNTINGYLGTSKKVDCPVSSLAFSPNGKYVATVDNDNFVRQWEVATGNGGQPLLSGYRVDAIAYNRAGKLLATIIDGNTVTGWNLTDNRQFPPVSHRNFVGCAAFSADATYLATGDEDNVATVWNARTGTKLTEMKHAGDVSRVGFSPDGQYLATVSSDKTVCVWNAATGRQVTEIRHQAHVSSVVFSPAGRHLATGAADGTVSLWDASKGDEVTRTMHDGGVHSVVFSPDGKYLATASEDKTTRIWVWRQADLMALACSRLSRNLTREEWHAYFPGKLYRRTCANLSGPADLSRGP